MTLGVVTPSSLLANSIVNRDLVALNLLSFGSLELNILLLRRVLRIHYSPEVNKGCGELFTKE